MRTATAILRHNKYFMFKYSMTVFDYTTVNQTVT